MRTDDDGLLQALHEGLYETPLWQGFLTRLTARAGAIQTALLIRPPAQDSVITLGAGEDNPDPLRTILLGDAARAMRPERLYALEDLAVPVHALNDAGLRNMRAVRVTEPGGLDGWIAAAGGKAFGSAAGALLLALAPHLRIALRSFAALERERFRSSVTGQAFDRLQMGWLTLDAQCRIIEASPRIEDMFQWGALLRRGRYDRLTPVSAAIDRELTALVKRYASGTGQRPQAFNLSQDPWVDMLVTPAPPSGFAGGPAPAALLYVSGDRRSQADRCDQLVELFGLLPSEARLAWMLAQATSIGEAAEALGLTVETARNYSKKIYAKTGARGHAELVRIILTSVLAIS